MIAIEKPQLPKLPKLKFGEGTFAYTDNGAIAYKKYIKGSFSAGMLSGEYWHDKAVSRLYLMPFPIA